jgi:hypothetical protein
VRVLIGCEESGTVRDAFENRGHDAWSCDLLPTRSEQTRLSGKHIQDDVLLHLSDGWDMGIFFPDCTYLTSSGLHWNKRVPGREEKTHQAMLFVFNLMGEGFVDNPIPKIALENPIGRIGTAYRKADQIIQPYQFGHDASKATCLWLKGLPLLQPTNVLTPYRFAPNGKAIWANQTPSGQNKLGPSPTRARERSTTYAGIAAAMADQWGTVC